MEKYFEMLDSFKTIENSLSAICQIIPPQNPAPVNEKFCHLILKSYFLPLGLLIEKMSNFLNCPTESPIVFKQTLTNLSNFMREFSYLEDSFIKYEFPLTRFDCAEFVAHLYETLEENNKEEIKKLLSEDE